jgi:hypothetical protein
MGLSLKLRRRFNMGYHLLLLKSEYNIYLDKNLGECHRTLDYDGIGSFVEWNTRDYNLNNSFFSKRKAIKKAKELYKLVYKDPKIKIGSYVSVERCIWGLDGPGKVVYKQVKGGE